MTADEVKPMWRYVVPWMIITDDKDKRRARDEKDDETKEEGPLPC